MSIKTEFETKVLLDHVDCMRIIHLIPYMHPTAGGPPVVVDHWASSLAAMGHRVEVITTDAYSDNDKLWVREYAQRYAIFVGHKWGPSGFGFSREMRTQLIQSLPHADLVHVHNLWGFTNQLAGHYCPKLGVPYVVSTHGMLDPHSMARKSWKKRAYGQLREWPSLRRAAGVIYTHDEEMRLASQTFGDLPRGHVVPLGADLPESAREILANEYWHDHPFQPGRPMILFLGRLHEKKGLELLIPAMAKIPSEKRPRLMLVGPGESDYVRLLENLVATLGLTGDVQFVGALRGRKKQSIIAASDIFVLPSFQENFAITVVEALHAGTPVILSDRVNLCDDLLSHDAAVRCELDADSIASEIMSLLDSPQRRQVLASNGQNLAAERYTWAKSSERLIEVYRDVLGRGEAHTAVSQGMGV